MRRGDARPMISVLFYKLQAFFSLNHRVHSFFQGGNARLLLPEPNLLFLAAAFQQYHAIPEAL